MKRVNRIMALARALAGAPVVLGDLQGSPTWPSSASDLLESWPHTHRETALSAPQARLPMPNKEPNLTLPLTTPPLSIPTSAQIAGEYHAGTLHLRSSAPIQMSIFASPWVPAPVGVQIDALSLLPKPCATAQGWLTVRDTAVMPLAWIPSFLLGQLGTGPEVMQQLWKTLEPPGSQPDGASLTPPHAWSLRGHTVEDKLRVHVTRAQWLGVHATLDQTVDVDSSGTVTPGAGSLRYRGSPKQLVRFLEEQLLPLAGLPPGEPPQVRNELSASSVVADVTWGPSESNPATFTLRATMQANDWTCQTTLYRSYDSEGRHQDDVLHVSARGKLTELTAGGPLQAAAASSHASFLRPLLERTHAAAHQWISPKARSDAEATLHFVGRNKNDAWRGLLRVQVTHDRWLDSIHARLHIGTAIPAPFSKQELSWPDPASELEPFEFSATSLAPALRAAHGVARFATGSRFHLDSQTLHDLGMVDDTITATIDMQRYVRAHPTAWVGAMPQAVWQSVRNLLRRPEPSL